jgi:hypothetical protein
VKGDQGLGNRILSLLSGILLARITRRELVVDWRDPFYSDGTHDPFPALFSLAPTLSCTPLAALPETDSVRPAVWRGHLREPAAEMRALLLGERAPGPRAWRPLCVELDRVDHPEHVLVFTGYSEQIDPLRRFLTGDLARLRGLPTAEILRRIWADHLLLAPALAERVDDFRRAHLDRPTLGVHVRATDRRTRIIAIEAVTARLVERSPDLRIFLATDNSDVLRHYRARFCDVVASEKWYPPAGERMHGHPDRPDPLRDAADALVDMHLLAACDELIVDSRSSFGRLAALRSRAADVIDLHPGRFLPAVVNRALLRVRDALVESPLGRARRTAGRP